MNKDELIKKLENLDLPEVELQSHQRQLKMALLNSGYWKGERTTMSLLKKQIVPVGGIIAIAAIIVVFSFVFKGATPQANAQQIAQKSYQAVSALTPEQKEALKQTVHIGDPLSVLQEAVNAEDLEVFTYDEFVSQYPDAMPPGPHPIDMSDVKVLRFTNPSGVTIALFIDQDNLPVLMIGSYGQPPVGSPRPSGGEEKGLNYRFDDGEPGLSEGGKAPPKE